MKIKLIVGFRRDQEHTIDAEEAHKAYHLFFNPEARTVFNTGLAIKGDQIQEIVPDWNATMGWNASHVLDGDDWNDIHSKGIDTKMQQILATAKEVAQLGEPSDLNKPLSAIIRKEVPQISSATKALADKFKMEPHSLTN